jgi:hypothetical protein
LPDASTSGFLFFSYLFFSFVPLPLKVIVNAFVITNIESPSPFESKGLFSGVRTQKSPPDISQNGQYLTGKYKNAINWC